MLVMIRKLLQKVHSTVWSVALLICLLLGLCILDHSISDHSTRRGSAVVLFLDATCIENPVRRRNAL